MTTHRERLNALAERPAKLSTTMLTDYMADDITLKEVVADTGLSEEAVRSWERRTGHRFLREREITVRHIAEAMKPADAVEYLLGVVEAMQIAVGRFNDDVFHGQSVPPLQRKLVNYLHSRIGETCSKEMIFQALYADRVPDDDLPALKIVDVVACAVRAKLPDCYSIRAIRGIGYRLELAETAK